MPRIVAHTIAASQLLGNKIWMKNCLSLHAIPPQQPLQSKTWRSYKEALAQYLFCLSWAVVKDLNTKIKSKLLNKAIQNGRRRRNSKEIKEVDNLSSNPKRVSHDGFHSKASRKQSGPVEFWPNPSCCSILHGHNFGLYIRFGGG